MGRAKCGCYLCRWIGDSMIQIGDSIKSTFNWTFADIYWIIPVAKISQACKQFVIRCFTDAVHSWSPENKSIKDSSKVVYSRTLCSSVAIGVNDVASDAQYIIYENLSDASSDHVRVNSHAEVHSRTDSRLLKLWRNLPSQHLFWGDFVGRPAALLLSRDVLSSGVISPTISQRYVWVPVSWNQRLMGNHEEYKVILFRLLPQTELIDHCHNYEMKEYEVSQCEPKAKLLSSIFSNILHKLTI